VQILDKSFRPDVFFDHVRGVRARLLMLDYGVLLSDPPCQRHALPLPAQEHLLYHVAGSADTRVVLVCDCDARTVAERLTVRPAPKIWGVSGLQRLLPDGRCEFAHFEERGSGICSPLITLHH
jgi:hypothetical protein